MKKYRWKIFLKDTSMTDIETDDLFFNPKTRVLHLDAGEIAFPVENVWYWVQNLSWVKKSDEKENFTS